MKKPGQMVLKKKPVHCHNNGSVTSNCSRENNVYRINLNCLKDIYNSNVIIADHLNLLLA